MKSAIVLFILEISVFQLGYAQQIFDWRPENRTGVSADTGLLKSWLDAGPKLLWSTSDLIRGNSTPSFGENKMYITGIKDGNDLLFALDMNGKIVWQKVMGRAWNASYPESQAMPTVEGNRV